MPWPPRFNPATAVQVYCTAEGRADWLKTWPGREMRIDPDTAHCLVVECGLGLFAFAKDDPTPDKRYTISPQALREARKATPTR